MDQVHVHCEEVSQWKEQAPRQAIIAMNTNSRVTVEFCVLHPYLALSGLFRDTHPLSWICFRHKYVIVPGFDLFQNLQHRTIEPSKASIVLKKRLSYLWIILLLMPSPSVFTQNPRG